MSATTPPSDCPFCLHNGLLKSDIITETEGAFLVEAYKSPGCHLIIPKTHIEEPAKLPAVWWQDVSTLLPHIADLPEDYNLSFNIGAAAGQTVKHLHMWVIPRLAGKPSSGKGLARFIALADKTPLQSE